MNVVQILTRTAQQIEVRNHDTHAPGTLLDVDADADGHFFAVPGHQNLTVDDAPVYASLSWRT